MVRPDTPESYSVDLQDGQTLTIGRKPTGSKLLILPFPEVSSQHAEIRCKEDYWTIVDSGSTNGTTLNGARLTPGREYHLKDKDRIGIAQHLLIVSNPSDPGDSSSSDRDDEQEITQFHIHLINATILVGDIKRFSSLMEEYASNPALIMQAASRIFDKLNEEIENNSGHLEKVAGDAIMAYWHGDNTRNGISLQAYRACTTALHLRELSTNLGEDKSLWPFPNHPFMLDLSLATGPVATGALGHFQGNPAVLGDTANIAFRLEKLIADDKPGDIVVDGSTYDLVKDWFNFNFQGEFPVKGRQRTVLVYQLISAKEMKP